MTTALSVNPRRWAVIFAVVAAVAVAIAGVVTLTYPRTSTGLGPADTQGVSAKGPPARVERVEGTNVSRVVLTGEAAKRLNVQTTAVSAEAIAGTPRTVISYAAVIYDRSGQTWTYTNPEPLVFVRQRITVQTIHADRAILSDGPAAGTTVVTSGAAELYGTELGVGR
jgi:hypothetical protein